MSDIDNKNDTSSSALMIYYSSNDKNKYRYGSTTDKLFIAERITYGLNNTVAVQNIMILVGYIQKKIDDFSLAYTTALDAYINQKISLTNKLGAHKTFEDLFAVSQKDLRYLIKIAKLALKNYPSKCDKLRLNAKRERSMADSFVYMEVFYTHILDDQEILNCLSAFGYHVDRIRGFFDAFIQARDAFINYCTVNSDSIEATRFKNLKIKELDGWVNEYYALTQVAAALI